MRMPNFGSPRVGSLTLENFYFLDFEVGLILLGLLHLSVLLSHKLRTNCEILRTVST